LKKLLRLKTSSQNARPNINYSQLLHDEFGNDPELSNKEVSFRATEDQER